MLPPNLYARVHLLLCASSTRDRGCGAHPVFPAPSDWRAGKEDASLGQFMSREGRPIFSRHRPRRRTIQYSRDVSDRTEKPRRTGSSACAEDDSGVCVAPFPRAEHCARNDAERLRDAGCRRMGRAKRNPSSLFGVAGVGGYRGACHRARLRATRWLHPSYGTCWIETDCFTSPPMTLSRASPANNKQEETPC
jgi:hypothetical protein